MEILAYLPPVILTSAFMLAIIKVPKEDMRVLLTHFMIFATIVGVFGSMAYVLAPMVGGV